MGEARRRREAIARARMVDGGGGFVVSTGLMLEVSHRPFPRMVPGEHLWTMTAAWRVPEPPDVMAGESVHLDLENMLSVAGPGCMWCEQIWSPELAAAPCNGSEDPL